MILDVNEIKKILPHRPPMLLVDRIIDLVPFESGVGIKNVTLNEPFFPGHFPGNPIMPGVFILEAMGQDRALWRYGERQIQKAGRAGGSTGHEGAAGPCGEGEFRQAPRRGVRRRYVCRAGRFHFRLKKTGKRADLS